jgi:predicted PolB exonuclease-like 3'-5' exonuclease
LRGAISIEAFRTTDPNSIVFEVERLRLSVRPLARLAQDEERRCTGREARSRRGLGKATLHEISRIMGLPGKPKGFDGGEVERYFREGKIKEIADYCETDVINTYQVWLRYELFRGTLSHSAIEASRQDLADFINARSNTLLIK